ncbi:LacI family transcriptional regulator [Listeria weihenstephanensis FSL R9-0317]|uniref:HTH lacI-type domain-containing protein n=1 Tax=Listeria weihenstephanensis TaxID=1006155 RepID=A0A1S7FQP8_9LIST|nr:LacI family DNA-binding transcriptional regulator [Listeria weihenstephanensis]AQY49720.1 hypothetical protein UE46_00675 [Listeria weihenstephanensis]EUJ41010.1 LacI family transcriptional regulator [Listeria weihenstephanensis FSL R9-0317]
MSNIKDIAKLAGVSVTTVSRVLNDHPYVAEEKRKRVQEVMEELDYSPNRNAVDLSRGRTNTIGFVLPYNDHPWFDKVMNGVLEAAFARCYSVVICPTGYDQKEEERYLRMLKTKRIDGLVIASRANNWETIAPYANYGPIVACEYIDHPLISCAYVDQLQAYTDGFQMLKDSGHARVAFTVGREEKWSNSTKLKIAAYEAVFGELDQALFMLDCYNVADGKLAAEMFLGLENPPTALYANGDEVAAGMHYYMTHHGLRVPTDIAILGEENLPIAEVLDITTLDKNLRDIGRVAVDILLEEKVEKKQVQHEIIRRNSI